MASCVSMRIHMIRQYLSEASQASSSWIFKRMRCRLRENFKLQLQEMHSKGKLSICVQTFERVILAGAIEKRRAECEIRVDRGKRLIPWKQHEQRSFSPPFTWRNWDFVPLSGKKVKMLKNFVGYARISRILEASKCSRDRREILCIIIGWKHNWSVLDCSLSRDCEDNRIHRLAWTNMSINKLLSTSVWRAHRGTPNSSESILTLMKIQKRNVRMEHEWFEGECNRSWTGGMVGKELWIFANY